MQEPSDIPVGLHNLEYARWLLENILGWPGVRANLDLLAECLTVVCKSKRMKNHEACAWLALQILTARERGIAVTKWWLQEGEFNNLETARDNLYPAYEPIDREAVAREQATPEWQAVNEQLRQSLRKIAFPERKTNSRDKLRAQVAEVEAKRAKP